MRPVKKLFKIVLRILFSLNLLLLLIAIASPYISPYYFWPPAVAGLFFRVFILIHFIFLLILLFGKQWKLFFIALAVFILALPNILNIIALKPNYKPGQQPNVVLMSYNVSEFGWHEDSLITNQVARNLKAISPDILCLQEYYLHPRKHKKILDLLKRELGYQYYYEYVTEVLPLDNRVGMAVFSKIKFNNFNPIVFPNSSNGAFYVDFFTANDTFRLFNVHFQSFSLTPTEYVMPGISTLKDSIEARKNIVKRSLQKMRNAFRKRSYQCQLVVDEIENSPYKIILCGDFNDTPTSYLYRQLTRRLDDAFLKTSFGLGSTFAGNLPDLRIDYILTSPEIPVAKTYVLKQKAGDHYPIISHLTIEK